MPSSPDKARLSPTAEVATVGATAAAVATLLAGVLDRLGAGLTGDEQGALTILMVAAGSWLSHRRRA